MAGLALPCAFALLVSVLSPVGAGERGAANGDGLAVELNGLAQAGDACRVTFVSRNGLAADLANVSLEIVVFDTDSIVRHLTIFDFGDLPAGKARVRQFELPSTECGKVGRLLVNGVSTCEGASAGACEAQLRLDNRTAIDFGG